MSGGLVFVLACMVGGVVLAAGWDWWQRRGETEDDTGDATGQPTRQRPAPSVSIPSTSGLSAYPSGMTAERAWETYVRGVGVWTRVLAEQSVQFGSWTRSEADARTRAGEQRAFALPVSSEDLAAQVGAKLASGRPFSRHDMMSLMFRIEALWPVGWALGLLDEPFDLDERADGEGMVTLLGAWTPEQIRAYRPTLRPHEEVVAAAERMGLLYGDSEQELVGRTDQRELQVRRSRALERSRALNWLTSDLQVLDRAQPSDFELEEPEPAPLPVGAVAWTHWLVAAALVAESLADVADHVLPGDNPSRARNSLESLPVELDLAQRTLLRRAVVMKGDLVPHIEALFAVPAVAWALQLTDEIELLAMPFSWMPGSDVELGMLCDRAALRDRDALHERAEALLQGLDDLDVGDALLYAEASVEVLAFCQAERLQQVVASLSASEG